MTDQQLDQLLATASAHPGLPPSFGQEVRRRLSSPPEAPPALQSFRTLLLSIPSLWPRTTVSLAAAVVLLAVAHWVWSAATEAAVASTPKSSSPGPATADSLAWMRMHHQLGDAEFAQACATHEAHRAECERLCAKLQQARKQLHAARQIHASETPELRSQEDHVQACEQQAILQVRKVMASLHPEEARRYVKQMLPHLPDDHEAVQTFTALSTLPPRKP